MKTMIRQAAGLCAVLVAAFAAGTGRAATNIWDGGGADNNWSTAANWNPDGDVPQSASNTTVRLDGVTRTSPAQNVAEPFLLNRLEILNGPASGGKAAFSLSGGQLQLVANGATPPRVYTTREATSAINNAIDIPAGTTLMLEIGTHGFSLNGAVSGGGGIEKLQNAGGLDLKNSTTASRAA